MIINKIKGLQQYLKEYRSLRLDAEELLDRIIDECKELPDQQWQTIDEFKANPVDGWCWIQHKSLKTTMSHYKRIFTVDGEMFAYEYITHVMPIKTPEAPK